MSLPVIKRQTIDAVSAQMGDAEFRKRIFERMRRDNPTLDKWICDCADQFSEHYGRDAGQRAFNCMVNVYHFLDNQAEADQLASQFV